MERLLLNPDSRYPQASLSTQNRMRDEFLCLLLPHYPDLKTNLDRVRDNVPLGMVKKSMYFVATRQHLESESNIGRSVMNLGEASEILKFVAHILQEGYEQGRITVLAMYDGQVALIKGKLKQAGHQEIRCCTVDRYQGDENQIVIVSLVRSNTSHEAFNKKMFKPFLVFHTG
ncbi:unnamed protein product [Polarella glacialis]|uniref:DNA2/NAM7 helicase-like C-terminal domain-containing protein n=1 Tax=Polarella glacialis TaxID=89957 RepID=A0A813D1L0_POLGL|nr:unnamed protein product [Polarella glacialis]